jgi:hypothetical protein
MGVRSTKSIKGGRVGEPNRRSSADMHFAPNAVGSCGMAGAGALHVEATRESTGRIGETTRQTRRNLR